MTQVIVPVVRRVKVQNPSGKFEWRQIAFFEKAETRNGHLLYTTECGNKRCFFCGKDTTKLGFGRRIICSFKKFLPKAKETHTISAATHQPLARQAIA
jgi:hypothetical protein